MEDIFSFDEDDVAAGFDESDDVAAGFDESDDVAARFEDLDNGVARFEDSDDVSARFKDSAEAVLRSSSVVADNGENPLAPVAFRVAAAFEPDRPGRRRFFTNGAMLISDWCFE